MDNDTLKDPTTVITIDGPVGVGKSSVAKEVARRLGYQHIDTGATYRVVTLAAMNRNVPLDDQQALADLANSLLIDLSYHDGRLRVLCDGEDVTDEIREPEVSKNTSPVADCIGVRKAMGRFQRTLGREGKVVCEGRDMGTVIFPEAKWKFYLDADPEERARRRSEQLREMNKSTSLDKELQAIIARDQRDKTRPFGALRVADGATIIDTTNYTLEEVVDLIVQQVSKNKNT